MYAHTGAFTLVSKKVRKAQVTTAISSKSMALFPKIPWVRLVMWNVVFMKKLNVISEASGFLLFTGESKNGDKILMISIYKFVWRLINSKQFINKVNIEDETQEVVAHDMW